MQYYIKKTLYYEFISINRSVSYNVLWQLTGFTSFGTMLSWVRIPPERKRSVAQWVERMFNPVISPYYVPTAIAAYFFRLDDSGKIRRLLVKTIAEDGDMQEIYKDYLFEKHILVSENNVEEKNVKS